MLISSALSAIANNKSKLGGGEFHGNSIIRYVTRFFRLVMMMGRSVAELMLFRYTQIIHHARKFVNKRLEAICFHLTRL